MRACSRRCAASARCIQSQPPHCAAHGRTRGHAIGARFEDADQPAVGTARRDLDELAGRHAPHEHGAPGAHAHDARAPGHEPLDTCRDRRNGNVAVGRRAALLARPAAGAHGPTSSSARAAP